ncbi:amino acid adenylation domain-containing protein [Variovorax sp. OK605]|uniref:non-ribosomal peptide synthetase n=1 Tax=Variovorax sp. OK605 TaxID=1855317 RepID=UPI0008E1E9DE|nr:non-ribosomal peptide synthetase [Variovorax sp. OK605]SFP23866.1 amino acid adenylation domain-containing protein [Variovorax sp. OK605]
MAAILEDTIGATFALSPEQRAVAAMLPAETAAAGATLALLVLLADIEGALDAPRLKAAVQAVLQAHGALRCAVLQVPGFRGLRQRTRDAMPPLRWQALDLRDSADSAAVFADWFAAFANEPLDVADGVPVRAGLVRLGETRHRLALAASAFAADAGSLHTLFAQIAAAHAGGQAPDEEETFQYAQFVEWRQDLDGGDEAPQGRAYWRGHVGDAAALSAPRLDLRGEGASASQAPALLPARFSRTQRIDSELATRLRNAATAANIPVETLLQAAWWSLVARLNGYRPFAGGWQHDCRRDYEVMQGAVGVFEKVLPVRIELAPHTPFADWAVRLGETLGAHAEAQEYWAVDAPETVAHLAVGFAVSEHAHMQAGMGTGTGTAWRVEEAPGPMPCFEVALQVNRSGDTFTLALHADASRYTPRAAERLLLQLATLLDGAAARPDEPVSGLPVVGAEERAMLLAAQGTAVDFGDCTLAAHVARWSETTPDAPALEAGELRMSYREFDARINRMAHWLKARGVAAGGRVALELPRSADLLVAMLAAWRVGASYLPLDPEWPAARRRAVLADAAPSLVLQAAAPQPGDEAAWPRAVPADIELGDFPDSPPGHAASMDDLAYVLYTSGSTGTPKGVVIAQSNLLNYVASASAAMDLARCRRWGLTSSVVADLGNTALFGAFFNGACLVVAGDADVKDARAFAGFMRERRIDALKMVPSHLEALLEDDAPVLPRTLVLGGEATPRALVERLARLAPECAVYNHYGPTETTVGVMVHRVSSADAAVPVLPLSRVLANNRVHVLDEALQLVPSGGLGAVYVGGAQLCRGYLNRDVEGAFVEDPFRPGERLYRTGDLAHVLPEGGIRLAGRADHQVKIRGFRVEPAEVEATLLAQAGVRQAVVLALPAAGAPAGAAAGATLSAFVVPGPELALDAARAALAAQLATLLPAHMLPSGYTFVEAFARLPNGKIDRLSLSALAMQDAQPPRATAPRDALEFVLAEAMARLLQRDAIGVEEDFFELGGHSLLVIKLVARLRKLLQTEVAPGLVFDHASAAELAAALRADEANDVPRMEALAQAHRQASQPAMTSPMPSRATQDA